MTDIIEDAGAYEQWDPKHPNFVKNYNKFKKTNPEGKLKDFIDHMKNKPTQLPEEYDIESMLEYIQELESRLEESLGADMLQGLKSSGNPKLAGAKKYNPEKKQGGSVPFKRGVADKKDYDSDTRDPKSGRSYVESLDSDEGIQTERYDADLDANKNGKLDSDDFKKLRDKKKKHCCSESIQEMLESVIAGDLVESKQTFGDILTAKIAARLSEAKVAIAQSLFGVVESKDSDEDDEKSSETSDEDFNKHPLAQLQKIADYKPNTKEEDLEYNADGTPDKRSLRALEDRKKKGGSTSGKPTFKHKNGEESDIHPDHAQHLVNVLKGSAVKPDTKKAVLDTIHGSKAGLDKVKSALGTGVVKNKSIYSDARE